LRRDANCGDHRLHVCGTTENVPLVEHLEAHHLNVMLEMETDPATDTSVIHRETGLLGTPPPPSLGHR
jgi:hypothetical protein